MRTVNENFKILKWSKQYIEKHKNTWDEINKMRKRPSVIIYEWKINSTINFDINATGAFFINFSVKQKKDIETNIINLVKNNIWEKEKLEWHFWISWDFKILTKRSVKVAEEIYDLLLKHIKEYRN